ncbi:ZIP zinc/iron transport family [Rhizodiscina lignyota]|uniref:ZIP zinc/iron transport family n=1 Tax=Rhizodiscina lignyota TaxID=1504668 RepID=A0A9P4M0U9_9PEZI|nr:ZIP zinc/iron transport family [Rhizodiscina lignyota]
MSSPDFNPNKVDLDTADPTQVICYLQLGQNEYNGSLGARISALFVILIVSSAATFFPVLAARTHYVKIPEYLYLLARYFGAGVIVATAFVQAHQPSLLDPAYGEIGPNTCVGMTGGWSVYSWPPAIILVSVMSMFLLDFAAERYVEVKYGIGPAVAERDTANAAHLTTPGDGHEETQSQLGRKERTVDTIEPEDEKAIMDRSFRSQIAAFLILEFGVIFHSVIIGLNLGTAGSEFTTLYPVLVFHQSFEGLGVGARMSAIPFPSRWAWLQWALCAGYGLTTPIAIAIGLGLRTTYNSGSYTANVVSGVFDALSAGILIYTGLVELLARDFLFDPNRTSDNRKLVFMIICTLLGAGLMALLGKWA